MKFLHPMFQELIPATHSPFHADGTLAPEVVPAQAAFLAANGSTTAFITGSTGESHSLTLDEKLSLYDAWAEAGPTHGVRVIAHVGANCLEDSKMLARRAQEHGFVAISALAPSYFKPGSLTALVDCCAAIAAAAPEIPFYYYDIPVLTGVSFPIERFLIEAPSRIPNFAGVKFTNPDLVSFRRSLDVATTNQELLWGIDEMLLAALATGARGGVGSTYNWATDLYRDLISAHDRGDLQEARRLQSISIAMIDAIASTGFLGTAKALMARLGVPVGPARLPLGNPTPSQIDGMMNKLGELGFAEWGASQV